MATLMELRDELANAPSVLDTTIQGEPTALFAGLRKARIAYVAVTDGIAHAQAVDAIVKDWNTPQEVAYWLARLPQPLVDTTVVYMADRTATTVTAAQIETFCNSVWKDAAGGNQPGAGDIRRFNVAPVDGKTVQVSGMFHLVGNNTWEQRTYLIRLIDPNGALTIVSGNIKFERLV